MLIIEVNNIMQRDYFYELVEPIGKNFDIEFCPELTPQQMLELGVFEGKYLNDCVKEYPSEWFLKAKLSPIAPDEKINCFGVKSRQPLSVWQKNGWIIPPDPRGWFEWYCRYYHGRRLPEIDYKQIKRWKAFKRHKAQIQINCVPGDLLCRPRQRQALLQWAYNPFI